MTTSFTRLHHTRKRPIVQGIPRVYMLIEKGDLLGGRVYKVHVSDFTRRTTTVHKALS
jgi:hypothetical protein